MRARANCLENIMSLPFQKAYLRHITQRCYSFLPVNDNFPSSHSPSFFPFDLEYSLLFSFKNEKGKWWCLQRTFEKFGRTNFPSWTTALIRESANLAQRVQCTRVENVSENLITTRNNYEHKAPSDMSLTLALVRIIHFRNICHRVLSLIYTLACLRIYFLPFSQPINFPRLFQDSGA